MRRKGMKQSHNKKAKLTLKNFRSLNAVLILAGTLISSGTSSIYADEAVDFSTNANDTTIASVEATNDIQSYKEKVLSKIQFLHDDALKSIKIAIQVDPNSLEKATNLLNNNYTLLLDQVSQASDIPSIDVIANNAKDKLDPKKALHTILQESIITEIVPTLDPELEKLREASIVAIHEKAKEVDMLINENNGKYISQRQWTIYHDEIARLTDNHPGNPIYTISISTSVDETKDTKFETLNELEQIKFSLTQRIFIMKPLFMRMEAIYSGFIDEINTLPYLDKEEAAKLKVLFETEKKRAYAAIIDMDDKSVNNAEVYVEEFKKNLTDIVMPYHKLNMMRQPYVKRLTAAKDAKEEVFKSYRSNPRYLAEFAESDLRSAYSGAYIDLAHAQNEREAESILVEALAKFEKIHKNIQMRKIRIEELEKLYKAMYRDINAMKWLESRGQILNHLDEITKDAFDEIDEITDANEVAEVVSDVKQEIEKLYNDAEKDNAQIETHVKDVIQEAKDAQEKLDSLTNMTPEAISDYKELIDGLIEPLTSEDTPEDIKDILVATPDEIKEILKEAEAKSDLMNDLDKTVRDAEGEIEKLEKISKPVKLKTKSKIRRQFNTIGKDLSALDVTQLKDNVENAKNNINDAVEEAKNLNSKIANADANINNSKSNLADEIEHLKHLCPDEKNGMLDKLNDVKATVTEEIKNVDTPALVDSIVNKANVEMNLIRDEANKVAEEKTEILDDLTDSGSFAKDLIDSLENLSEDDKKSAVNKIDEKVSEVSSRVDKDSRDVFASHADFVKDTINSILEDAAISDAEAEGKENDLSDQKTSIPEGEKLPDSTDEEILPVIKDEAIEGSGAHVTEDPDENNDTVINEVIPSELNKDQDLNNDDNLTPAEEDSKEKSGDTITSFQDEILPLSPSVTTDSDSTDLKDNKKEENSKSEFDSKDENIDDNDEEKNVTEYSETEDSVHASSARSKRLPKTSDTSRGVKLGLLALSSSVIALIASRYIKINR